MQPGVKLFACENMGAGCTFTGLLAQVEEHEKQCPLAVQPASPPAPPAAPAPAPQRSRGRAPSRRSGQQRAAEEEEAEVGVPPASTGASTYRTTPREPEPEPAPSAAVRQATTPPRASPLPPSPSPSASKALREMPEATQSGINIGGKWYDAAPPSSGKRDAKRRLAEVSVEFTEPGNLGIGWEVLGRNEILAVFTTEKLGIDWVS